MKNQLYWECEKCGWKTPRHPNTKPEEMPLCDKYLDKPISLGLEWDNKKRQMVTKYQYRCNGKLIERENYEV